MAIVACAATSTVRSDRQELRIVDVGTGRFVSERELVDALVAADFSLLGERHDNPTHHAARAHLIRAVTDRGRRPALVLEPFDLEHDAALMSAQREGADVDGVVDAGRLDRNAWQWPLHRPIVDAALSTGLRLRAGNLSRTRIRELLQRGSPGSERFPDVRWSAAQQAALVEEIVEGHCRKLPAEAVPRLVLAQRLRDDAMAQALIEAANGDGALLVAGNGHVRKDLGVVPYLRARSTQARVVSVGFIEIDAGEAAAPARVAARHSGFDYVVITEPRARADPCAAVSVSDGRSAQQAVPAIPDHPR